MFLKVTTEMPNCLVEIVAALQRVKETPPDENGKFFMQAAPNENYAITAEAARIMQIHVSSLMMKEMKPDHCMHVITELFRLAVDEIIFNLLETYNRNPGVSYLVYKR